MAVLAFVHEGLELYVSSTVLLERPVNAIYGSCDVESGTPLTAKM
jgi:hypothetical protein